MKMLKKLGLYVYFSQKWVYIEEVLIKLSKHFFLIKDDELLEKYNEIWEKVRNNIKKEFGSEPVYNKKYLKAKQKTKRRFSIFLFIGNFDWFCF